MPFNALYDPGTLRKVFTFAFVNAAATTVIRAAPAFIHSVTWCLIPGAVAPSFTLYNDPATTNNPILSVTGATTGEVLGNSSVLNCEMTNGITLVTTGTTPAIVTVTFST